MDRSVAGRSAFGPFVLPRRSSAKPRAAGRRPARGAARSPALRPPAALSRAARSLFALLWQRRSTRIALIVVLAAIPVLPGAWLLVRHSSLVAVRSVQIIGVRGPDAPAIEAALTRAARRMSTLDVNSSALRSAVTPFTVVRSVKAIPRFPHGMRIEVVEQPPVAVLVGGGGRTAVAGNGVVLGPALLSSSLPTVKGWALPPAGKVLHDRGLLGAVAILGAAPATLRKHVERIYMGSKGLTGAMRNGLLVYFGDGSLAHAKWLALAAVLASSSSSGADYIDVRVPSHPAAGFPAGGGPVSESTGTSSTESTVGAIAAGLAGEGRAASEPSTGSGETSGETGTGESGSGGSTESGEAAAEAPAAGG